MSENLALGQAESWKSTLATYWDAVDHLAHLNTYHDAETCETCEEIRTDFDGADDADKLAEYLHSMPLEIVWEIGEPFSVVLGTGGPHTEITGGGRWSGSGYTLECYWGGDRATLRGEAINRTGDYFRDLVES